MTLKDSVKKRIDLSLLIAMGNDNDGFTVLGVVGDVETLFGNAWYV